jgi:hypothetical protein
MARDLKEKSTWEIAAPGAGPDFVAKGTTRREALVNLLSLIDSYLTSEREILASYEEARATVATALEAEDGGA